MNNPSGEIIQFLHQVLHNPSHESSNSLCSTTWRNISSASIPSADHPVTNLHRWRSSQYLWITSFLDIIHALHNRSSDEAFMKTHAAYEKLMKHVVTSSVDDLDQIESRYNHNG